MNILLQRRAEIALRSLDKAEQKKILRSLSTIENIDRVNLAQDPKFHKLATGFSGKNLYIYKGSPKIRLILSFEEDACTVEDIVDHDRLSRLMAQRGRE